MTRAIKVFLGDRARRVGVLRYDREGPKESASFEYDASWLGAADRFPIEPGLPLVIGPQFHRRSREGSLFHNAIADTEPDGWGRRVILRDHAKRSQNRTKAGQPLLSLDFLLAVDDASRVGALRFQDEGGAFLRAPEEGRRTAPPLIELGHLVAASRAVESQTESAADLEYLRGRATSLGGLRPKCTVVDAQGQLAIGKFPSIADDRAVTKGEVLAMQLAAAAKIDVAKAKLIDSDGTPVALIQRFDRSKGGRIMYVSAATLLGVDSGDPSERSYTEIVDILRTIGADARADIEELWRRIAFSILITNVDDHLHNHGFLHARGGLWRLSPAFDLNPFPDRQRELKTWISEEAGPEASIEALRSVGPYFRLTKKRTEEILEEVEAAVAKWRAVGKKIGMTKAELDQFADAFEHSERL